MSTDSKEVGDGSAPGGGSRCVVACGSGSAFGYGNRAMILDLEDTQTPTQRFNAVIDGYLGDGARLEMRWAVSATSSSSSPQRRRRLDSLAAPSMDPDAWSAGV